MLKNLTIKNYALIKELSIDPSKEFNVVTGETGAGKSIMLGALGLLLGNRADVKSLFNHDEKCFIEASFEIGQYRLETFFVEADLDYEPTTIVRREITPSGKSRAFINDTPTNLDTLKKLGVLLIDIHSQHDNLLLGNNLFQLAFIDNFAQHHGLLENYKISFETYVKSNERYEVLIEQTRQLTSDEDYFKFQLQELDKAGLEHLDQEGLEEELKTLENAEEIKSKLHQSLVILDQDDQSINAALQQVDSYLNQLASISSRYEALANQVSNSLYELKDVANELEKAQDEVEFNPTRVDEVKESLSLLYQLQQKHQVHTVQELIQIQNEIQEKVHRVTNMDEALKKAEQVKNEAYKEVLSLGDKLSKSRKKHTQPLEQSITDILSGLGMEDATINIAIASKTPDVNGIDNVNLMFSANKGVPPQALKKVASGGEFSRLLFTIKYILATKTALPTMIFDEIDTGISGEVAIKMASMMKQMAENHQVIAISHLPQFAAKGDAHYFVFKDSSDLKTTSKVKKLNEEERVEEIAKMIGGNSPSATAFENARELMSVN